MAHTDLQMNWFSDRDERENLSYAAWKEQLTMEEEDGKMFLNRYLVGQCPAQSEGLILLKNRDRSHPMTYTL